MYKILFVTLSNIGDTILTLPALDALIGLYPEAKITVVCGPRPKEIFENNPGIARLIVYDKHSSVWEKIRLFSELNAQKFDMVIDLRNTMFGILLKSSFRSNPFNRPPEDLAHAKDRHLFKIRGLIDSRISGAKEFERASFHIGDNDRRYIDDVLGRSGIGCADRFLAIAPGARSSTKRWAADNFKKVIEAVRPGILPKAVLVGDEGDMPTCGSICSGLKDVVNLCGRTSLRQLAALLNKASLLLTNDSATMHLASYLNRPIAAIFGPTDERRYGPWSDKCVVLRASLACAPCREAQCRYGTLECLKSVTPFEVIDAIRKTIRI
ncbi:MAG: glycosyltransferase family 9 protein [Candidatus Omnitrophica bacterium]|nr:glycosyltransferase family 9 protein [Candidatus Omnitrophota bacterium]